VDNEIGIITGLDADGPQLAKLERAGVRVCQLLSWQPELWTQELARTARTAAEEKDIRITAFWAGWSGPRVWDFLSGPRTLGIVPKEFRARRRQELKTAGPFARALGVPAVITHLGFIPEDPADPTFERLVEAVRDIAEALGEHGLEFWFETGQETPVAMLRLIREAATGNLGVNLDPANLILYGKGNPVDALDVLGPYVRNVHAKDGLYPTDPMKLGTEVKVGTGRVDFPRLIDRLGEIGYAGELIIEREISGPQQEKDVRETVAYLRGLLRKERS